MTVNSSIADKNQQLIKTKSPLPQPPPSPTLYTPLKGTVSVILSDPPSKESNARYTTVPFNALSDQV